MSIVCQCPSCKAKYQLGEQFAGSKIKCPKCNGVVEVPEAAAGEASSAAPKAAAIAKPAAPAKPAPDLSAAKSSVRIAKAAPIDRPAKAQSASVDELEPLASDDEGGGLGFLDEVPAPKKKNASQSGIHDEASHDSSIFGGDPLALSSVGSSKVGSKSALASKSTLGSKSIKGGHSQLRKKNPKSAPVWMIPAVIGGGVIALALVLGLIFFNPFAASSNNGVAKTEDPNKDTSPLQAANANPNIPKLTFTFHWAESERKGATLTINGEAQTVPATGDVKIQLPKVTKPYSFVLQRDGFESKSFSRPLTEDDDYTVTNWESSRPKGVVDWEQDFDAAKKAATEQHKDLLIVFDASDAQANKYVSSRFNDAVASRTEFAEKANKDFICVYIDNPEGDAKAKVKDIEQNHKVTGNFEIKLFPTVVVTDSRGRPYGVMDGYSINGVNAFIELMEKWQEDRKSVFSLLERSKDSNDSELLAKTLDVLELNKLDRFYKKTVKNLTQKLPNGGMREVTESEAHLWGQKFQQALANPDNVKKLLADFDAWKAKRSFKKHPEYGAGLHAFAAMLLLNIGEKDEAKKRYDEAVAFNCKDQRIAYLLSVVQQALTGKPGENVPLPRGSGSGYCIAQGNYIMTNHHVIDGAKKIMIHLNGDEEKYPAHLIADNEDGDMAVIKIDLPAGKDLTPIPFVKDDVGVGDDVCAFGWPGLLSENPMSTLTNGLISTIDGTEGFLVTNCKIEHGNSGGPLCSVSGCAICGMVSRKTGTGGQLSESYGMAIPASKLKAWLREKLPHDVLIKVPRPTNVTGIRLAEVVKRVQPNVVYVENYQ